MPDDIFVDLLKELVTAWNTDDYDRFEAALHRAQIALASYDRVHPLFRRGALDPMAEPDTS